MNRTLLLNSRNKLKRGLLKKARFILSFLIIVNCTSSLFSFQTKDEIDNILNIAMDIEDLDSQMVMLDSAYKLLMRTDDIQGLAINVSLKADNYFERGLLDMSLEQFLLCLQLIKSLEEPEWIDEWNKYSAYDNIANILSEVEEHTTAQKYYDSTILVGKNLLRISEKTEDVEDISSSLDDTQYFAFLSFRKVAFLDSIKEKGLGLIAKFESTNCYFKLGVMNSLGTLELDEGRYESSRRIFREILSDSCGTDVNNKVALHNMAETYSKQRDYGMALAYLDSAINLVVPESNISNHSLFTSLLDKGNVLVMLKKYGLAINEWERALALDVDISNYPELFIVHEFLEDVNRLIGNEVLSNTYGELFEVFKSNYEESSESIKARNQTEAIRSILALHENQNLKRHLRSDYLAYTITISVIVIFLAFYFMRRRRDQKRKLLFGKLGDILMEDKPKPR